MKYLYSLLVLTFVIGQIVAAVLDLPLKIFYDLDNAKDLFDEYLVEYEKQYNEEQYLTHYEIFKENLVKINELNRNTNLTVFGINQFTDLKFEEIASTYMGMSGKIDVTDIYEYEPTGFAPASLNYRDKGWVTEVKSQGNCNTCYIFSAIGSIEGQQAKQHGKLISLSEQQALDCESGNGCITGGFPTETMRVLAKQGGSMREKDYPYIVRKKQCSTKHEKIVVKVIGGSQLSVKNENELKDALANYGPLSIGLTVNENFGRYKGGIFHDDCHGPGKHAVLLVGYDSVNGEDFWIIKNSWSTIWGEEGYMRMKLGISLCDIGKYVVVAKVA